MGVGLWVTGLFGSEMYLRSWPTVLSQNSCFSSCNRRLEWPRRSEENFGDSHDQVGRWTFDEAPEGPEESSSDHLVRNQSMVSVVGVGVLGNSPTETAPT